MSPLWYAYPDDDTPVARCACGLSLPCHAAHTALENLQLISRGPQFVTEPTYYQTHSRKVGRPYGRKRDYEKVAA